MTIRARSAAIRAEAERGAALIMRQAEKASAEDAEAVADGVLRGTMIALMRIVGTERAYQVFQSHSDVLDRALRDAGPPAKPGRGWVI